MRAQVFSVFISALHMREQVITFPTVILLPLLGKVAVY